VSISRVYQPVPLHIQATIRLEQKAGHHLVHVLRARTGDKLTLFNGAGGEYESVIVNIDKKGVDVNITSFMPREVEPPCHIYLAQGLARGEKMDFIVQKAVELGVQKIIPLLTEHCNVRLDNERKEKRLQHWQGIAVNACEQCGRNRLPGITSPISFETWLPTVKAGLCFVLSPHVQNKLPTDTLPSCASIVLLIGPEGGLSDNEIKAAIQHGFLPLNLGPRVLRTETASLAAITILQYRHGDLS
jgi:16S rRNA (uracil1498-N3)-methyltransferase